MKFFDQPKEKWRKYFLRRTDVYAKVTGGEKFAADYSQPDFVWAVVKRAGVAHARAESIWTEQAENLPGVDVVLTHSDVCGSNRQGVVKKDQPVLVGDKIRHHGDAVPLLLAEDKATSRRAIDLTSMDPEVLSAVFDCEDAGGVPRQTLHSADCRRVSAE